MPELSATLATRDDERVERATSDAFFSLRRMLEALEATSLPLRDAVEDVAVGEVEGEAKTATTVLGLASVVGMRLATV